MGLYLLYGMVAQGIALCWGRAGFLPLGQALFFGIGAYLSGAALKADLGWALLIPAFAVACLVPALLAGLIGALVFNRQTGSGPYFSLITLALSMLGFQLANSLSGITGGFNGMTAIPGLPGIDTYETLYFVIVGVLVVSTLVLAHVMRAPFGQLLIAIRENEERLQFFGFRTSMLKAAAFAISGGIAGLAGALYAPHQGIVTPQAVGFVLSAELLIWTAVGGRFGLIGPVAGAVLIGFMAAGLRDSFRYWEVAVALVFILVVLKMPGGISGLFSAAKSRIGGERPSRGSGTAPLMLAGKEHRAVPDLRFDGVGVSMGPVRILNGLSFSISRTGIHCIIGPNGAGKTSALNVLTGRLPLGAGEISWRGVSLGNTRPFIVARNGIGRKFQVPSIFPELSVRQNIEIALWANRIGTTEMFSMRPYGWTTQMLGELKIRFPFLMQSDKMAGSLSVGQRQMLDFSMTVLAEPDLVLLDEPCAGLSADETRQMIEAIAAIAVETKATFIIIEHDMQVVERLSDHVLVMHQGALLANGTMTEIRANADVARVYSGGSK
ncbi:branched-chain amino acid ABC transporter ATP-binding protein/permease [Marinovum algicola]|uniref:branched-chain amino acid ABC transporter ATP-binding protein/permease n=1 Tax=Marinovum algicola TaxID=42444 RepID=UPI0032EC9320